MRTLQRRSLASDKGTVIHQSSHFPPKGRMWFVVALAASVMVACTGTPGTLDGRPNGAAGTPGAGSGQGGPVGPDGQPTDPNDPSNPPPDVPLPQLPTEEDPNAVDSEKLFACQSNQTEGPSAPRVWRLSGDQYEQSVVFFSPKLEGSAIETAASVLNSSPGPVFSNVASRGAMDPPTLEALLDTAGISARTLTDGSHLPKKQSLECILTNSPVDQACVTRVTTYTLSRAFRRPPTPEEVERYVARLMPIASSKGGNEAHLHLITSALIAPEFIFRTELGGTDSPKGKRLTPFEIANAISMTLTKEPPDSQLYEAALKNELDNVEVIQAQVMRLFNGEAKKGAPPPPPGLTLKSFVSQLYDYGATREVLKDDLGDRFGKTNNGAYYSQVWGNNSIKPTEDWLLSLVGKPNYLSSVLIGKVGSSADAAGLLTEIPMLWAYSQPEETDPIRRGKFITERLLCNAMPSIDLSLVPVVPENPTATLREKLSLHSSNPKCSGCHMALDGIGLGLERFNDIGLRRDTEQGKPVVTTGVLVGSGNSDGPFNGPVELSQKLASSTRARQCLVRQLFRYTSGRNEAEGDACVLKRADDKMKAAGTLSDVLVAYFTSDRFLYRR
jgi:Protein of unknown function (DUF1588)/Protein of unknown function (DUF1585)/Protein of unknown function (DUF1595)/Protein of unknown function (DUF1592)